VGIRRERREILRRRIPLRAGKSRGSLRRKELAKKAIVSIIEVFGWWGGNISLLLSPVSNRRRAAPASSNRLLNLMGSVWYDTRERFYLSREGSRCL